MSAASPVRLALKAALTSPGLSLLAAGIVALTAFAGAVAPGALQSVQTSSLRYALTGDPPAARDLTAVTRSTPLVGQGRQATASRLPGDLALTWGAALDELDGIRVDMDPVIADIVDDPRIVVTLDRAGVDPIDPDARRPVTELVTALDPLFEQRVRFVEGAMPVYRDDDPVLEFALAASSAEAMQWSIGETRRIVFDERVLDVTLAGTFEALDPADPAWAHTINALRPSIIQVPLGLPINLGLAFLSPDALPRAATLPDLATTEVWYPLEPDAVTADRVPDLVPALRLFAATTQFFSVEPAEGFYPDGLSFESSAALTLERATERTDAVAAIGALVASGPLAVAVVVLALSARMVALRRRSSLLLAQARGASPTLLGALLAAEGLVIGGVGAAAGGAAGAWLGASGTGGDPGAVVAVVPAITVVTLAVALPVLGLSLLRRRTRADGTSVSVVVARWRLGAELALVGLTGAVVALLLTREPSAEGPPGGIDPLLTSLPLLLAGVGSIAALRILPAVLALVGRGSPRTRGLVSMLGPARAQRDPATRVAPVLAVVVGVAIAVFAVSFLITVERGIETAARTVVGADMRVTAGYINDEQVGRMAEVAGVEALAPVYADEMSDAQLPDGPLPVMVYVIDVAELAAVQDDPDSAIPLPDGLLAGVGADGSVPVIASQKLVDLVGSETLEVEGEPVEILAAAPSDTPLGSTQTWIAVDRSVAGELVSTTVSPAVALIALDPGADERAVADAMRDILGPRSTATTPGIVEAERRADPALAGIQAALVAVIALVALYLTLAVAMTLVLGATARGRLLALLGALGFRRSRESSLVIWEIAPAVVLALPLGVLVGIWLPFLVVDQIDLTGFVGGGAPPVVRLGGGAPALVAALFLLVTALAVAAAALIARRVTAARTLRTIDEEG